jgi:hypothetical protein
LANGLCVIQFPNTDGNRVTVETILAHSSGEYISESLTMVAIMDTPQSIGSAITYARRYSLLAALGVATCDDDGAAASRKPAKQTPKAQETTPEAQETAPDGYTEWKLTMILAGRKGMGELKKAWSASTKAHCKFAREQDSQWWEALKACTTTEQVAVAA